MGRDLNINTGGGHAAVSGRDTKQHVEGFDASELLAIMTSIRHAIDGPQVATFEREALTDQVVAIEAIASSNGLECSRGGESAEKPLESYLGSIRRSLLASQRHPPALPSPVVRVHTSHGLPRVSLKGERVGATTVSSGDWGG